MEAQKKKNVTSERRDKKKEIILQIERQNVIKKKIKDWPM